MANIREIEVVPATDQAVAPPRPLGLVAGDTAITASRASRVLLRRVRAWARGLGIDVTPELCVQVINDYRHERFRAVFPQLYAQAWAADPVTTYCLTKKNKKEWRGL